MFLSPSAEGYTFAVGPQNMEELRVMPLYSVMSRQISHLTSNFSYLLLPTPPIKLKLVLQICWRLLVANHLEQSL
jgi:hypothetical protein